MAHERHASWSGGLGGRVGGRKAQDGADDQSCRVRRCAVEDRVVRECVDHAAREYHEAQQRRVERALRRRIR